MAHALVEPNSAEVIEAFQELVDSIVAAVDSSRTGEVEQLRRALEPFGLSEAFRDELWLAGSSSGETCWICEDFLEEVG